MTAGLEVYSASGKLLAGVTSRLARITGSVTTVANVAGSVNIPGSGTPFYVARNLSKDGMFHSSNSPSITLSGTNLSWTAADRVFSITYGVN